MGTRATNTKKLAAYAQLMSKYGLTLLKIEGLEMHRGVSLAKSEEPKVKAAQDYSQELTDKDLENFDAETEKQIKRALGVENG